MEQSIANIERALPFCMPPILCGCRLRQDDSNDGNVLGKGGGATEDTAI